MATNNDELASRFFEDGKRIAGHITIQRSAADIYAAWSGLAGITQFVETLDNVSRSSGNTLRFHGRVDGEEYAGEAQILNEEPNRLIAWRTADAASVPTAGSITLRELPFRRGTEVKVVIDYIPPKGGLSQRWDKIMGKDPRVFLKLALFRFRQFMEAGEVATTKGQPTGRFGGRDEQGSKDERLLASNTENRP